jgi:hypothetical protein
LKLVSYIAGLLMALASLSVADVSSVSPDKKPAQTKWSSFFRMPKLSNGTTTGESLTGRAASVLFNELFIFLVRQPIWLHDFPIAFWHEPSERIPASLT